MLVFSVFILRNEMIPIPAYSERSLSLAFSLSFVVQDCVDCWEIYGLSNLKFMLNESVTVMFLWFSFAEFSPRCKVQNSLKVT